MYCTDFIFDNVKLSDQGFMICSFGGSSPDTVSAGATIDFTTFQVGNNWIKTDAKYTEPLKFTFSITKMVCGSDINKKNVYMNREDIAFCLRWLARKEFLYLNFLQDGYEDIFYKCRMQIEQHMFAGKCIGLDITGYCDAPYGYSDVKTLTLTINYNRPGIPIIEAPIYDDSDEIGEIYPYVEFVCNERSNVPMIWNLTTDEVIFVQNCVVGEKITIDSNFQISTDNPEHTTLATDFNYVYLRFGNSFEDRVTNITAIGIDSLTLKWRATRKGGI